MPSAGVIGQRLRNRRIARALSRRALGRLAGMSKSTVSRIENGESEPHAETLLSLASALGMTYAELTRPSGPKLRVAKPSLPTEIPIAVAKLLCTGRLGKVSDVELRQLVRNSNAPEFASDPALLELELLFRRACAAMHDRSLKQQFDAAFERIREEIING